MHYILAFLFLAQLCHVSLKCFRSLPSFCLLLHDADTASSSQADAYTIHYLCTSYKSPFPLCLSKGLQTKRKLLLIVFLCPLHPCLSYSSQPHPHVPSLFTTTFLLHPIPLHSPHLSQIPSFLLIPTPFSPICLHSPHLSQNPSFLLIPTLIYPTPFFTHPSPKSLPSYSIPNPSSHIPSLFYSPHHPPSAIPSLLPYSSQHPPSHIPTPFTQLNSLLIHSLQSLTIDSSTSSVASCTMSYCNIS